MRRKVLFLALEEANDVLKPFFLYLSTLDTYSPATRPDRHKGTFADEALAKPPSFNEPDVSDDPSWVRHCIRNVEPQECRLDEYRLVPGR